MSGKAQPAAKGYKPVRQLYKIDFSETPHVGMEMVARGTSMSGLLKLMDIADEIDGLMELDMESTPKSEIAGKLRDLFAPFAKVIVSWNLIDDDDEPVPASLDGLMSQDPQFVGEILGYYTQAMTQAPPPLPAASPSGGGSPEGPTPELAALSRGLPSS
jgi:hypothetical protein